MLRILVVVLALAPALFWGFQYRWEAYAIARSGELSPDAVGFARLAESEPYKYFNGWREPLWPFLLRAVSLIGNTTTEHASYLISLTASFLVIPFLFMVVLKTVGLVEATFSAYLIAFSHGHIATLAFAAREDLMLLGLFALLLAFAKERYGLAFLLAGILVHLRVSTLVFAVLFYGCLTAVDYLKNSERNPFLYLKHKHSKMDWILLGLGIVIAAPVLIYFQIQFGDPLTPQSVAVHEYFYREKYGKWLTDVTQNFFGITMPVPGLIRNMLLENNGALVLQSIKKLFLWNMLDYLATAGVVLFGVVVGFLLCLFNRKAFPLAAFFLVNSIPLIAIGWSEHFRPGLALVPGVMAIAFVAVTIGLVTRTLLALENPLTNPESST